MSWKPTACILCECNRGLEVGLGGEGGRHLVRLRGDRRHPSSQGYACEKPDPFVGTPWHERAPARIERL